MRSCASARSPNLLMPKLNFFFINILKTMVHFPNRVTTHPKKKYTQRKCQIQKIQWNLTEMKAKMHSKHTTTLRASQHTVPLKSTLDAASSSNERRRDDRMRDPGGQWAQRWGTWITERCVLRSSANNSPLQSAHVSASSRYVPHETVQIVFKIKNNKRRLFSLFHDNAGIGLSLEFQWRGRIMDDPRCCTLYGHFSVRSNGGRSSSKCSLCQLHFCLSTLHGHKSSFCQ